MLIPGCRWGEKDMEWISGSVALCSSATDAPTFCGYSYGYELPVSSLHSSDSAEILTSTQKKKLEFVLDKHKKGLELLSM